MQVLSSDPMYITRNPQILQRSTYQAGRTSPDLVDMKLVRMVQPRFWSFDYTFSTRDEECTENRTSSSLLREWEE